MERVWRWGLECGTGVHLRTGAAGTFSVHVEDPNHGAPFTVAKKNTRPTNGSKLWFVMRNSPEARRMLRRMAEILEESPDYPFTGKSKEDEPVKLTGGEKP